MHAVMCVLAEDADVGERKFRSFERSLLPLQQQNIKHTRVMKEMVLVSGGAGYIGSHTAVELI